MIEKTLLMEDCRIRVMMESGVVRIVNDLELWKFVGRDSNSRTVRLVKQLKAEYQQCFLQALQIEDSSLVLEIWGHLYYEWLALSVKHLLPVPWLRKKLKEMTGPATIIDCGEKRKDSNRWLWDLFAPLKGMIACILPRSISASTAARYKD